MEVGPGANSWASLLVDDVPAAVVVSIPDALSVDGVARADVAANSEAGTTMEVLELFSMDVSRKDVSWKIESETRA